MLSTSIINNVLEEACLRGADFAEVYEEDMLLRETQLADGEVEMNCSGRDHGIGIRMFRGEKCCYGYTNQKTEEALLGMVRRLAKDGTGRVCERKKLDSMLRYQMPEMTVSVSSLSAKKRLQPAMDAVKAGMEYDDEIIRMRVKLTDMEQCVQIANTEGLFVEDSREKTRLYIAAFAESGTDIQSGYYGPGAMMGHEFYEKINVEEAGREAARQAKVILHAEPCKGGRMPVIVAHGFGGLLFHEACGHSLEATVIAKKSSEFCGKLGKKVASDVVTLIDDGSIEGEWGSLHVDDEGIPTRKNILIEKGVLKSYMVDRLNGLRTGLSPTGSARRQNYKYCPVARMTNTYIAPGNVTPEAIIRATGYGLYVKSINGGSVDPATGAFNFSAGECYMIQDGKRTAPVRGVTLIGNGGSVIQGVDMVGNDFELRQGYCYASSGALFIGAGQPTVRVKSMTVGGIG